MEWKQGVHIGEINANRGLAGVKAVLQPQFNVGSITTTGGASTASGSMSGSYLG